ncbi:hypothetical protein [Sphingomonas sp. IC4-52]|uniref:hypothetical protein n=1 Tax=Sphingomonas sp. IC4-52 TaxID=2887202 RepID=UPI001D10558E|nr:hypothetical protein [Sphingomonas sp. IC4-52]MCC2978881.1 hypothetical protein [Sphingomonas sp. IC4-52]
MIPLRHPIEGQPFQLDLHPYHCDCPSCGDIANEAPLARTLANCAVAALGAVLLGQLIGVVLERTGFLAMIGIG